MASIQLTQVQSVARGRITPVGSIDVNVIDIKRVHQEKNYTLLALSVGQIAVQEKAEDIRERIKIAERIYRKFRPGN